MGAGAMNFLKLVRVEWIKTMRMRSTYIAFGAAAILVIMVHMGINMSADETDIFEFFAENGIDTSILVNAYAATRISLEIGFVLLIAPMVIQVFARQVAGEDLRGTLRLILSRPISRIALINAKFVVCSLFSIMLMGFMLFCSYGVGLMIYGPQQSVTVGQFEEYNDAYDLQEFQTRYNTAWAEEMGKR